MKIIIPVIGLEHHGGVRDLIEIANYLADKGNEVIFYVPYDRFNTHYRISPKVRIRKIRISGKPIFLPFLLLRYMFLEKADLYIANFFPTLYPLYFRSKFSGKLVYFIQDIEYYFRGFPLNFFAFLTYLLPVPNITLSHYLAKRLKFKKNLGVARAGVDRIFLQKDPIKDFYTPKLIVGHIWRKEKYKNSKMFLQILKKLDPQKFEFLIIAPEKYKTFFPSYVKLISPGNSVYLRDNFYSKIHILVHTSKIEGFGLPPLEAMAQKTVILATNSGGIMEYFNSEIGFIIKNVGEAVNILERLYKDRDRLKTMAERSREIAQNHPLERIGEEFWYCLKNLIREEKV